MPTLYSLRPSLGSASKTGKAALAENAVRAARSEQKGRLGDDSRTVVVQAGKIPAPSAAGYARRGLFELRAPHAMQFPQQYQQNQQQQQQQPSNAEQQHQQQAVYRLGGETAKHARARGNGVDILKRMSSTDYSSSGSAHEINSVCLAEMVHEFLEDEAEFGPPCGRARCNCESGSCGGSSLSPDDDDNDDAAAAPLSLAGEQADALRALVSCAGDLEAHILAAVAATVRAVSDEVEFFSGEKSSYRLVMSRLRAAGYNAAICKSRWEHTGGVPGGDYEYIDVVSESFGAKPERLIVDLDFRTQFEIARPSAHYKAMLQVVPQIFVGKAERLLQVLNVLCEATRRSVKKKGMPLPPWRKPEYTKAKWFSLYKRTTNACSSSSSSSSSSKDGGDVGGVIMRGPGWDPRFTTELETNFNRTADLRKVLRDSNCANHMRAAAAPALTTTGLPFKKQEATTEPEGVVRGARLVLAEMQQQQQLLIGGKSDAMVATRAGAGAAVVAAAPAEWEPPAVDYCARSRRAARKGTSMLAAIFTEGGAGARIQDAFREPRKRVLATGGGALF
ncbi:hypothetical protein MPTK1_7g07050 [Marchantia polymorpha subsp. ruderalis]|nr:hypothetical protein MARPO_0076s0089 [Marchantia polymorpha]BBN16521.1 hypothetical protein Mp_7g07050 [Marchantia polymorpha subsp. ruderalis]|eukprot:PTQ34857.1 hypothetical protein MARPO_0076s0089 [Marchantia polymorpha]